MSMIQNGIIINGVAYEFAQREVIEGDDCMECALHEKCHELIGDVICVILFDNRKNKTFKQVKQ